MTKLLYIPNIICYLRIFSLFLFIFFSDYEMYLQSILCYFISFSLDFFDGYFARLMNQTTKFGMILDMVIDRCSTLSLLFILYRLYNNSIFIFICILDISSHWFQMKVSEERHHKDIDKKRNFILQFYYSNYIFFGLCCIGAEINYLNLYYIYYTNDGNYTNNYGYILFLLSITKNVVNIFQLMDSIKLSLEK